MTENRLGGLAITGRTITLLHSIIVDREPGRVDPQFDEMADADMLLENGMRNLEIIGVLGVHGNAVD